MSHPAMLYPEMLPTPAAAPADSHRRALIGIAWKLAALATTGPAIVVGMSACGSGDGSANAAPTPSPQALGRAVVLTSALSSPWGMAFLPDGRMLVTQRRGALVIVGANGSTVSSPLSGVPAVVSVDEEGGLLDVAIDPDFETDPWVYWTYSEAGRGGSGTAVARGRLSGTALTNVQVIFRQLPEVSGKANFGSRLVFRSDKTLFVTLGDREEWSPAQDLTTHLGKVVRIERDGSVPVGNPHLGVSARPELWSFGHRNPQGAALHPTTGELWLVDHGPQGGDELNRVMPGGNYGWPIKSYGCSYGAPIGTTCRIGGGTHAPTYIEPVSYWVPRSIAPSGLVFYTGAGFPEWQGNAFLGALAGTALWRVELSGATEVSRERLFANLGERIRCVRQGPDGWLYLLTDSGKLIRIER